MKRLILLTWLSALMWGQGPVFPPASSAGNGTVIEVVIAGTAGQITASGTCTISTTGTCTLSVPSGFTLPGTINKITLTQPATGATLTLTDGKTFTVNKTLTLDGTDGVTITFPASSATVATLGLTNTFTGRQDASGAASTAPMKVGTSPPATCAVGDQFYDSDATAGSNLYGCTATNTWTLEAAGSTTPAGSSGNPQFNNGGAFGAQSNTIVLNGGTNVIAGSLAAGTKIILAANTTQNTSAISVTQANVTIECLPGVTLTRSTASVNLFTWTGAGGTVRGCILDGNSQNGGAVVSWNANSFTFEENIVQNFGTNSGAGWVRQTGGSGGWIRKNRLLAVGAEHGIMLSSSSAAISYVTVYDNYLENTADNVYSIYVQEISGTGAMRDIHIYENKMRGLACVRVGSDSITGGVEAVTEGGDTCYQTGTSGTSGFAWFGVIGGTFDHNIVNDGGQYRAIQPFQINDCFGCTVSANVANNTNAFNSGFLFLDDKALTLTGNMLYGLGDANPALNGFYFSTSSNSSYINDFVITGNEVFFLANKGNAFKFEVNSTGSTVSHNTLVGNHVFGTGTANQFGIVLTETTGTVDGHHIAENHFYNVPTAISIGSGVANTRIGDNFFDTVTTKVSDSGTTTIWDGAGAAVASATTTTLTAGGVIHITGTTAITTLNTCSAVSAGKRLTLIFDGILTFTDGNNLKLAGNMTTSADDSITLVCDGTNWYEVARSVN